MRSLSPTMSESKNDPPEPSSGPSVDDEDAPTSDDDRPVPLDDAANDDDDGAVKVTRELTNAFLVKKATQARIREVVQARVPHGTQAADVEDLVQETSAHALDTDKLARSVPGMRPWISRIAQNLVIDYCRRKGKDLQWLDRSVEVQELPPDDAAEGEEAERPADDPTAPPRPIELADDRKLDPWLGQNVKTAADRLTLEMLRYKGATKKTNAAIAAEFGMTEAAFDRRLQRFKSKWVPAWQREQKRRDRDRAIVWVVLVVLALAALVWWWMHRPKTEDIRPTSVPVLLPVPSASASAGPEERFNQAVPTDGGGLKP
jgi:DNA-directed RNA polymerase specialized sigma24 family protein